MKTFQVDKLTGEALEVAVATVRGDEPYFTGVIRLTGMAFTAAETHALAHLKEKRQLRREYLTGYKVLELIEEWAIGCEPTTDATWRAESVTTGDAATGLSFIEAVLRCYVLCEGSQKKLVTTSADFDDYEIDLDFE